MPPLPEDNEATPGRDYFASREGCWITEPGEPDQEAIESEVYRKHLEAAREHWRASKEGAPPADRWITEPGELDPEAVQSEAYRQHLEKIREEWRRATRNGNSSPPPAG